MKMAVFQRFRCFVGSPLFGTSCWPLAAFLLVSCWPLAGLLLASCWLLLASCWPLAGLLLAFAGLLLASLLASCWPLAGFLQATSFPTRISRPGCPRLRSVSWLLSFLFSTTTHCLYLNQICRIAEEALKLACRSLHRLESRWCL